MVCCLSPGEADAKVQEKQGEGVKNYNVKIILSFEKKDEEEEKDKESPEFCDLGILYDEGRKCVMKGKKVEICSNLE